MSKLDGFPHAVAVWLGLAFAVALSLLVAVAFGDCRGLEKAEHSAPVTA